jgi:hypothetical protein
MVTAYDYLWASILDAAGVDSILVGDTLGMVVQGKSSTVPVTVDEVIYHGEMVVRGTGFQDRVLDRRRPMVGNSAFGRSRSACHRRIGSVWGLPESARDY